MAKDMTNDDVQTNEMPEKVRAELNKALSELAKILATANKNLIRQGLEDWMFPAGVVTINNPNEICEVAYFPVVLNLQSKNDREIEFKPVCETSETAIYSPGRQEITNFSTSATSLSSGFCKKKNLGKPCPGSNGQLTCKKIRIAGDTVYVCLPSH